MENENTEEVKNKTLGKELIGIVLAMGVYLMLYSVDSSANYIPELNTLGRIVIPAIPAYLVYKAITL